MSSLVKSETKEVALPSDKIGKYYWYGSSNMIIRLTEIEDPDGKYPQYRYEYLVSVDPVIFERSDRKKSVSDFDQWYTEIKDFEKVKEVYAHLREHGSLPESHQEQEDKGTDLINPNSKDALILIQQTALEKKEQVEGVKKFVEAELQLQKNKLDHIRRGLEGTIKVFEKKIKKIFKVIQTIELYLGIKEDLVQLQEGMPADESEPINFRQSILYMDEEVGAWEDGGLDYRDVHLFEEWMLKDKNYEKLIPETKGVVVFKPRRYRKEYNNVMANAKMNEWNKHTYFLIRNGENIYRIDSDNIELTSRLFPLRDELQKMLENINEIDWESSKEKAQDEFDDTLGSYKKLAFLMQGLIDRTDVFNPMPKRISIFKMDENPDAINFIYDDEMLLPTGRLSFWDWVKEINQTIVPGSRVFNTGHFSEYAGSYTSAKDMKDRFTRYYYDHSVPSLPPSGVYQTYKGKERYKTDVFPHYYLPYLEQEGLLYEIIEEDAGRRFCLGYENFSTNYQNVLDLPIETFEHGDTTYIKAVKCRIRHDGTFIRYFPYSWRWHSDEHQSRRVSFEVFKDDYFILNYDRLNVEEIDFYLHSRVDRHNYHHLMPLLKGIRKRLIEEQKQEEEFIQFLWDQSRRKGIKANEEKLKAFAVELIDWWKYKVNQKRPISNDDSKAMRMIERRLFAKSNKKKIL